MPLAQTEYRVQIVKFQLIMAILCLAGACLYSSHMRFFVIHKHTQLTTEEMICKYISFIILFFRIHKGLEKDVK